MIRYKPNHAETGRFLRSARMYTLLRETTRNIARRARDLAPVDEGDYRDGIEVSYHSGWTDGRAVGEVEATAPYSAAVEWGNTGNAHTGQHILRRAAQHEEGT